jgi:hypothetical protein
VTVSPRARVASLIVGTAAGIAAVGSGATASTPPPTTNLTATSDGVFTDAAATFAIRFASPPTVVPDPGSTATSYVLGVDEDTESLSIVPPTAYSAVAETTANERAVLFLDASFDDVELVANSPTRLGPYPAAYFVSRITLADGRPAVIYGATVVRPDTVHYVFFTDVGGDDGDAGRAFVESYTVTIDPYPATTTTVTAGTAISAGDNASFDGRWWVRVPDDASVSLRASSEDGLAFTEYSASVGDDTLTVRVTEVPAAIEWFPTDAAATEAATAGSTVTSSEVTTVGGAPAARFRLAGADAVTEVLLVRSGGQLYRVAYVDRGERSPRDARAFVDSFELR